MSERGIELSDTVAQLVADARRQEGMSMDELAERAGVHRTYIGLLERRSRQPTLAVAANLAEALGLSLAELVGKAEEDVGNGVVSDIEIPSAPRRRHAERAHLGGGSRLAGVAQLTSGMIAQAIDFAYRKLDLIDEQMRGSGSPPLAKLVDLPHLSPLVANLLGAGIARASGGSYLQNGSEHGPSLTPLRQGLPELEVAAALETDRPASGAPSEGVYLTFRYVLAGRDGSFTRGKDSRGDTVAVWEARFGELESDDFHVTGAKSGAGIARVRKEALDDMELLYYDPELLPYAKPTGVYARVR
jgi:transcriptional regulator with XRE-family HTH domain